jgi:hypothetical protein
LADAVIGGRPAALRFAARRFFCDNPDCTAVTFAEQVPDLTARYARRTALLRCVVTSIALALAGRPGARLAAALGMNISRSSLLRLIRGLPDPLVTAVAVLGVDDFAFRRRHDYGTILVNMADGHPVDLLADREAGTFTAWLKAHPGTEVICRDRAGGYAQGARDGAPDAIQVADRWHLWHNPGQAVDKTVAAHRACLRDPVTDAPDPPLRIPDPQPPQPDPGPLELPETRLAARTRERYAAVQSRLRERQSIGAIARELPLTRHTVRRFARAQGCRCRGMWFDAIFPKGIRSYWKGNYVTELTDAAIDAHLLNGPNVPEVSATMHLYSINGAAHRVAPDETAFAYRHATFAPVYIAAWQDSAVDDARIKWVREYYEATAPHSEPGGYINFMQDDEPAEAHTWKVHRHRRGRQPDRRVAHRGVSTPEGRHRPGCSQARPVLRRTANQVGQRGVDPRREANRMATPVAISSSDNQAIPATASDTPVVGST